MLMQSWKRTIAIFFDFFDFIHIESLISRRTFGSRFALNLIHEIFNHEVEEVFLSCKTIRRIPFPKKYLGRTKRPNARFVFSSKAAVSKPEILKQPPLPDFFVIAAGRTNYPGTKKKFGNQGNIFGLGVFGVWNRG
jgi:hypothetical protein